LFLGGQMSKSWDSIINEINELSSLQPVLNKGVDADHKHRNLLEIIKSLRKDVDDEKEFFAKKLKETEDNYQFLWKLLDDKNTETEILDQRLAHADNETSNLKNLLAKEAAKITEMEKIKHNIEASKNDLVKENEMLHLQLHQLQHELDGSFLSQQQYEKNYQQLRDEIDALRRTLSWRVTAPLRRIFSGIKKLKS